MRSTLGKLAALLGTMFAVGLVVAAQDSPDSGGSSPGPRPTPEHKALRSEEGIWQATLKIWPGPDAEPIESKVVEVNHMMPGGLWLIQNARSISDSPAYHGHGFVGYDPHKKKYIATWIDNMSPSLLVMEGTYDDDHGTATFTGKTTDPAGKAIAVELVDVYKDDDHHTETISILPAEGAKGEKFKMLEGTYTRASGEELKRELGKGLIDIEKKVFDFEKKTRDDVKKRLEEVKKKRDFEKKKRDEDPKKGDDEDDDEL